LLPEGLGAVEAEVEFRAIPLSVTGATSSDGVLHDKLTECKLAAAEQLNTVPNGSHRCRPAAVADFDTAFDHAPASAQPNPVPWMPGGMIHDISEPSDAKLVSLAAHCAHQIRRCAE